MGETLKARLRQREFDSTLQESLLNLLVAAGHIREYIERECSMHGITHAQYNVLRILRGVHPDGHPRCEIIDRMVDRASDVTRLIDRLEKQGLVERTHSEKDRRMSISRITQKGLDLLKKIDMDALIKKHFAKRISLQDRKELSRICESLYS